MHGMLRPITLDRRSFVKASLAPTALPIAAAVARASAWAADAEASAPDVIDSNVHLFSWPFRKLKYDRTDALVAKLRRRRIHQAWAGSFEAVLHKQLDQVNRKLTEECRTRGEGLLLPIGSVNPAWPDWQDDLRRCHEQYRMPGVRLYPAYHGYTPEHPDFSRLLAIAAERGMLVQVVLRLEDERVHHPAIETPEVKPALLLQALKHVPRAKVQLLNAAGPLLGASLADLVAETQVVFDIAAVEGNGGVGRLIEGRNPSYRGAVPAERLLFGSHAPFFPCESALLKLFESPLSREQLEKVMHSNARRLLEA
jgi:uncharacterized protein